MQIPYCEFQSDMNCRCLLCLPIQPANPLFVVLIHPPTPPAHATSAAIAATQAANATALRINSPSEPRLVRVANTPARGVKAPYFHDWKSAAIEPAMTPLRPKPRPRIKMMTTVKDTAPTSIMEKTAACRKSKLDPTLFAVSTHMVVTARKREFPNSSGQDMRPWCDLL